MPLEPGAKQRRILIVEDDPHIRRTLIAVFREEGYNFKEADDGQEALNILQDWKADVIVLDLTMPVMDGWEFLQQQHAREPLSSIPVIVLSAVPNTRRVREEPSVKAVMQKPFDLFELIAAVDQACAA